MKGNAVRTWTILYKHTDTRVRVNVRTFSDLQEFSVEKVSEPSCG